MKKIVKIVILLILILVVLNVCVYASEDIIEGMKRETWNFGSTTQLANFFNSILGVVQIIALAVVTISVVVLGIRYMISSVNDKAAIKQQMMPIIIGSVLVFGAVSLLRLIQSFTDEIL